MSGALKGSSANASISATFPFLPQTSLHGHDKTGWIKTVPVGTAWLKSLSPGEMERHSWLWFGNCLHGTWERHSWTKLGNQIHWSLLLAWVSGGRRVWGRRRQDWGSRQSYQTPMPKNSWLRHDDERRLPCCGKHKPNKTEKQKT